MNDISTTLQQLGEIKKKANALYVEYKGFKEQEDQLKAELQVAMQETGLKSIKGEDYLASISSRRQVLVTHEQSVLDWLNETPDIETDFYIGLKTTEFKKFADGYTKKTGEIIPGTDFVTSESISIKENKK